MKKKRIAIVFDRLLVGGAEVSLLNFLRVFDRERYDVTLFVLNDQQAYLEELRKLVQIRYTQWDAHGQIKNDLKHFRFLQVTKGLLCRVMIRLRKDSFEKFALALWSYPKLPGRYDLALSYKLGHEDTGTVLTRVRAKKKCAILHGNADLIRDKVDKLAPWALLLMDQIYCVSYDLQLSLQQTYPRYAKKVKILHNQIDVQSILDLARCPADGMDHHPALCTVGRLSPEKGQILIPKAARLLVEAGHDIHWYLIGDGLARSAVEAQIREQGMEDRVLLLGTKDDPYPYIKNCDLYIQTSFTEGYGLTVAEAKLLKKPIIVTGLPVFAEQLDHGRTGWIADGVTSEALFKAICYLLDHPDIPKMLVDNLKNTVTDTNDELQQIYDLIES